MTKKEMLTALMMVSVSAIIIDKALIDADVNGDEEYTKEAVSEIDAAEFEVLKVIISRPDISEGDLTIKQSIEGVKLRLQYLAKKLGRESELTTSKESATISSPKIW